MATLTGLEAYQARLAALPALVQAEVLADLKPWEQDVTAMMATAAPWHDRTGNARRNLHAWTTPFGPVIYFYVAHGVPYGIHLELGFQGRYAVLWPTLRAAAPQIFAGLRTRLETRFGGRWTLVT